MPNLSCVEKCLPGKNKLAFLIGRLDDLLIEPEKELLLHQLRTGLIQESACKSNSKQMQQFFLKLVMAIEHIAQVKEQLRLKPLTWLILEYV